MRFSHKLSMIVVALLGVLFTFGGAFLVYHEFQNSLTTTIDHSTSQHYLEKYSLEADILARKSAGNRISDSYFESYGERFTRYMNFSEQQIGFYTSDESLYTTIPSFISEEYITLAIDSASEGTVIRKIGEQTFLLMASKVNEIDDVVYLLSVYDISSVYTQRLENMQFFWKLDFALLIVAVMASFFLSNVLTRSLKKLSIASATIAKGDYSKRVNVRTDDEIGALADSFNLMAEAIEEKMQMMQISMQQKDDFVLAFTHEVKTPMTTIIGYAGILRAKGCSPEVIERASTAIFSESKRLEVLSQKLLSLMGLSDTKLEMECQSLQSIFLKCEQSLQYMDAIEKMPTFSVEKKLLVETDTDLLVDLLRNLIINALSATQNKGRVWVRAIVKGPVCIIEVEDNGCGIAQEDLQHICEPFYMVDKARRRREGATGIGLSLCKRIVELHGSVLTFVSEVGKGTKVSFQLPVCSYVEMQQKESETKNEA